MEFDEWDTGDWVIDTLLELSIGDDGEIKEDVDLEELVASALEYWADPMYNSMKNGQRQLDHWRGIKHGFEQRLYIEWRDAIDLLETFIVISLEIGDEINHEHRPEAAKEEDHVFEALTFLHSRACQVAQEILALITSGFADGAEARWRTLHEISVTASVIKEHGDETAERFLLYSVIEEYYEAKAYQKHSEILGERVSEEHYESLQKTREALIERFGEDYDKMYGWAMHLFKDSSGGFRKLEEMADLEHIRPFYKVASDNVHGGSRGTTMSRGIMQYEGSEKRFLPAGPTNTGFSQPASATAISLSQVTFALMSQYPKPERVLMMNVLQKFVDDINDEFTKIESALEERELQYREEYEEQMEEWSEWVDEDGDQGGWWS